VNITASYFGGPDLNTPHRQPIQAKFGVLLTMIIVNQHSKTNVTHVSFNLLKINFHFNPVAAN
jgi:hypothetical protein